MPAVRLILGIKTDLKAPGPVRIVAFIVWDLSASTTSRVPLASPCFAFKFRMSMIGQPTFKVRALSGRLELSCSGVIYIGIYT